MAFIEISNLNTAGSDLFAGADSFLTELQTIETTQIFGGSKGGNGGYGGKKRTRGNYGKKRSRGNYGCKQSGSYSGSKCSGSYSSDKRNGSYSGWYC
jgi:hypothetical protein